MKDACGQGGGDRRSLRRTDRGTQALVQDYAKLTDIQALAALYAKDLDLLKQWASEDKAAYPDLEEKLAGLSAQAQEKLGNCTRQEELAPVLDGYCADVVRDAAGGCLASPPGRPPWASWTRLRKSSNAHAGR